MEEGIESVAFWGVVEVGAEPRTMVRKKVMMRKRMDSRERDV